MTTEKDYKEASKKLEDLTRDMQKDLEEYYRDNPEARKKLRKNAEKIKNAERNKKMLNIWEKY